MITLFVEENNPINQNFYDNVISNLQFHQLKCPCCHKSGVMKIHGYYKRSVKTPEGKTKLLICRVKCEDCGRTHALLLSSIVPYSQLPLKDHTEIISAFESPETTASQLKDCTSFDESSFRYVIRQYVKHWRQKLISEKINLSPPDSLICSCFRHYLRQFMQIKCTPNILFPLTT